MAGPSSISYSGRRVTIKTIAENLAMTPNTSIDRPVIDQTGLAGDFDFVLTFSYGAASMQGAAPGDQQAPFLEALKDQLGLKLVSTTGPADSFIIDHVAQPRRIDCCPKTLTEKTCPQTPFRCSRQIKDLALPRSRGKAASETLCF